LPPWSSADGEGETRGPSDGLGESSGEGLRDTDAAGGRLSWAGLPREPPATAYAAIENAAATIAAATPYIVTRSHPFMDHRLRIDTLRNG
jgi:hypothetical protein